MAKGHMIAPGHTLSSLALPQVRMILRIYWTDRYRRRKLGLRSTTGLKPRLAREFDVSIEVIKKIVAIKHNQHGRRRRQRFKTIALKTIQRNVQKREERRDGIERTNGNRKAGRPRKKMRVRPTAGAMRQG